MTMQRLIFSRALQHGPSIVKMGQRMQRKAIQNKALIVSAAAVAASATSLTWCEKPTEELHTAEKKDEVSVKTDEESNETSPNENMDEEDEPTTCTICLINRQGPCRPKWRKFERCMKDNGSEEGVGDKCDEIMIPWIKCVQSYRNTYTLITNKFYQTDFVDDLEKSISDEDKKVQEKLHTTKFVNLDNYHKYCLGKLEEDEEKKATSEESKNENETDEKDPTLVEATVSINFKDGDKEISLAYVRDQDGNLLGFDQFSSYKKLRKEYSEASETKNDSQNEETSSNNNASKVDEDGKAAQDVVELPTVGSCTFNIQPGKTVSVRVYAYYKELPRSELKTQSKEENETEKSDEIELAHTLYVSASVPLPVY